MKTLFQLFRTFILQLASSKTYHQKMPALIPVRVVTKVNRDQY